MHAAMKFIRFATGITQARADFGGEKPNPRDLSPLENVVYDSALTTLIEYFNAPGFGEIHTVSANEGVSDKCPDL